jgi:hypothetical protein
MATFSKRHYVKLSEVLRVKLTHARMDDDDPYSVNVRTSVALGIITETADMLQRDNPAFDRERFMNACGL